MCLCRARVCVWALGSVVVVLLLTFGGVNSTAKFRHPVSTQEAGEYETQIFCMRMCVCVCVCVIALHSIPLIPILFLPFLFFFLKQKKNRTTTACIHDIVQPQKQLQHHFLPYFARKLVSRDDYG